MTAHPDLPIKARVDLWLAFQDDPIAFLRYVEQALATLAQSAHSAHALPWHTAAAFVAAAATTLERRP